MQNSSLVKILPVFILFCISSAAFAVDFDLTSIRVTVSKPNTSHSLIYTNPAIPDAKSVFNLVPQNNERLGIFADINGIEIGYAVDVFEDETETKTQNFLFSYRKWKHSKITLNYQTLKGLDTQAENLSGDGLENQFLIETKSTKTELFGLHNLYTFDNKDSLFEHFFLNRPKLSSQFDWSVSVVADWSLKRVSLTSADSIVFQPQFISEDLPAITRLDSDSINATVGPMLSLSFPRNIHFFVEYKLGAGYISNKNADIGFKESGDEKSKALGAGFSWTSIDKKTLVLLRAWDQKGRHINTSFGDLSVVRFF
jgi:hypothetical protein